MKLQDIIASKKAVLLASADSELIRELQMRFHSLGLPIGEIDGEFGLYTGWCFYRFCKAFDQPDQEITPGIAKLLIETGQLPLLLAWQTNLDSPWW